MIFGVATLCARRAAEAGRSVQRDRHGNRAVGGARLLLALAAFACAGETLVTSLSTDRIAITSIFNGASLVVFGVVEREGERRRRRRL